MLLLYHQNLEKKTVKSIQNIFIRSIGFFIRQGSCPCKASAAKRKCRNRNASCTNDLVKTFCATTAEKNKHIFGQKGNSKLLPCVLQ